MNKNTHGFTIVELLIVIVVIAILAAISVIAYNGIQGRAQDSARQSDAAQLRKKLDMMVIDDKEIDASTSNTRAGVLTYYELQSMDAKLVVCTPDYSDADCTSVTPAKDKLYWAANWCGDRYSYWLNSDKLWHITRLRQDGDTINVLSVGTDDEGPSTNDGCG